MESQAPLSTSTPTNQFSLQSGLASQKRKRDIEYYTSSPAHKARRGTQSAPQHTQNEFQPPPQLQPRPHLHINYLARQSPQDVRLLSTAESLPATLALLNAYHAILDRSESLAANLGARPWSQVLLASFYRMFDGPPHVVESPSYIESSVTWLDVVEFAATYPDRFILPPEDVSTGARVCDCWIKGCKVRVSEHDWLLVKSGALQRVIPPQPVREDEERELGTCEILEEIVGSVVGLADQVAARARLFNHSLQSRKQAIVSRRATETAVSGSALLQSSQLTQPHQESPDSFSLQQQDTSTQTNPNPGSFFHDETPETHATAIQQQQRSSAKPSTVPESIREALLRTFTSTQTRSHHFFPAVPHQQQLPQVSSNDPPGSALPNLTNTQNHPHQPPAPIHLDDRYKLHMQARVDLLPRYARIHPPCDRCRRLRMECLKNLSACIGCTKKHAKCSWRQVRDGEMDGAAANAQFGVGSGYAGAGVVPGMGGGPGQQVRKRSEEVGAAASNGDVESVRESLRYPDEGQGNIVALQEEVVG